ncbi:YeiH family protein [Haloarcula onubensis]|uniref:Sulfate exporter family transporter n=1 Tax=Haloarcula onubensis TaxID=2950539 RepID=A0ABU2FQQ7_9EURY|nr:putative sulfate exporter family transporter [Halomicroarcula sp. S3CR25-11]MDS0282739.1 putative sulfate exporter family transporter [Halomicroarcula sp. S3CR25-11]
MRAGGRVVPGLVALLVLGALARAVGTATPLSPLVVAIGAGALVAALVGVPEWVEPGLDRHKLLLETGIVLLGAQLTLGQLVTTGPVVVVLAMGVVVVGVVFVELVGRQAGIESRTRSLLAAGASVCGVSAVLAVAGSIDGDEADISYAAGTVLLFDAVTLVAFPVLGTALGLPDRVFGVWAGLSLFSTGPTAAVGFAVSETAGQWATITKLVRNTFIGVLAVAYALYYTTGDERADPTEIWYRFPKFLVGFLLVALIANLGLVDAPTQSAVETVGDWLFTLAFVGLGFELNPRRLRSTGVRPLLVVLAQFVTVSLLALGAAVLLV